MRHGPRPAHPRSRGENSKVQAALLEQCGSSPLTRGKRDRDARPWRAVRLIPAHAGKTSAATWRKRSAWAHPRSRGENVRLELTRPALRGSSPLTRGKPTRSPTTLKKRGLIPAHAGKTPTDSSLIGLYGAHPRSRGENEAFAALLGSPLGSSPLTRGKQTSRGDEVYTLRLIPAHAGKTGAATPILTGGGAHPRSRGENHPRARSGLAQRGSSPLTRGKQGGNP